MLFILYTFLDVYSLPDPALFEGYVELLSFAFVCCICRRLKWGHAYSSCANGWYGV